MPVVTEFWKHYQVRSLERTLRMLVHSDYLSYVSPHPSDKNRNQAFSEPDPMEHVVAAAMLLDEYLFNHTPPEKEDVAFSAQLLETYQRYEKWRRIAQGYSEDYSFSMRGVVALRKWVPSLSHLFMHPNDHKFQRKMADQIRSDAIRTRVKFLLSLRSSESDEERRDHEEEIAKLHEELNEIKERHAA